MSTTAAAPDKVDAPSAEHQAVTTASDLIHDLVGGTRRMREAGAKWLPPHEKETPVQYTLRIGSAVLYNAYRDTRDKLVGRPFSQPVKVEGELPERLQPIEKNADRAGADLTQFGTASLKDSIDHSRGFILVDYPATGGAQSVADEREKDIRPYFVMISARDLLGRRWATGADGRRELVQLRFRQCTTEPHGAFGEQEVEYVNVWTKEQIVRYRKAKGDSDYVPQPAVTNSLSKIPLVEYDLTKDGTPPLEDLAWLNLRHWQQSSDYCSHLRFASIGFIFMAGMSESDLEKPLAIGPLTVRGSTNENARCEYVEAKGTAIGAGRQALIDLKEEMMVMGLQPLLDKGGTRTATEIDAGESRSDCELRQWVRALERALTDAFLLAAEWVKTTLDASFRVNVFSDFGLSLRASTEVQALISMRQSGEITQKTFLNEMKRRGLFHEAFDVEAEIEETKLEAPRGGLLSMFGAPDGGAAQPERQADKPGTGGNPTPAAGAQAAAA